MTVSIPSFEKPTNALDVGRNPEHMRIVNAANMTHSGWKYSVARTQNMKKTIKTV